MAIISNFPESSHTNASITEEEKAYWNAKVDAVDGMGLSSNDYTDEEKEKVANIPTDVENVQLVLYSEYTEDDIQGLWDSVVI